jgi:hypothetical protein
VVVVNCSVCGTAGARRWQKVNPRNFKLEYLLACAKCARDKGFSAPTALVSRAGYLKRDT